MSSTETPAGLLDLEECLTDSPGFRNKVRRFEEYAASLETAVQGLAKASRVLQQVSDDYSVKSTEMLSRVANVSKLSPLQDTKVDQTLRGFSEVVKDIERNRVMQNEQFQNIVVAPMEALVGDDSELVQTIKAGRRRLDMQQTDYESQLARSMARKETGLEQDVEVAKSRYLHGLQLHSVDLNRLAALKKVEFLESYLSLMYAQYAFYHQAFSSLKDFEPAMRQLGEHIAQARRTAEQEIAESQELIVAPKRHTNVARSTHDSQSFDDDGYVRVGQQDDDNAYGSVRSVEALGEPTDKPTENTGGSVRKSRRAAHRANRKSLASISLSASGLFQMSGYLFLRSQYSLMASWQRRWFEIKDGQLVHVQRGDGRDSEAIPLHLCQVKTAQNHQMQDRRNTFELIAPTRTYLLQAENEHDLGAWTACLRQAIEASLYAHMPAQMQPAASTPSAAQSQANSASNTPALMQLDSFSVSRASSTQRSDNDNEAQRARIKALRAVAGNESCVDCGRRAPEWAAINLGALMCIECSGVHRSLGVHVSKVRSVKLDNWEPELLQIMLRLGNRAVNQIYEAVPPHPGDPAKPEPRMPRDQAAPFLSAKYASRVWVCPGETTEEKPTAGLFGAVRSGNLEAALTALAQGADVNAHDELSGSTPLIAAARTGDFGMLELLLLWGADINARGRMTATAYTTDSPHVDHAKQEATAKSEIIVGGGTALHLAARLGNVHMVWYLIRKGAQWDTPDAYGLLPLDIALEDSDVQVVMALRYAAFQKASGLPPGTLGSTRARHYTQGNAEQVDMLEMDDSLIQGWAIPPYVPKAERLSGEFTEFVDSSTTADAAFDEPLDSSENQMVSGTAALSISPPPPPRVSVSTNPTQPAQQNES